MAQSITLPVKLQIENLQNILQEMKGALGNLKVDSSSYKKLSGIIADVEKRIQSLQVASNRPMVDTKQFADMEKEVSKIQDDLIKIQLEAGKIKFGDISLSSEQQGKLEQFNQQIQEINAALKQVKESAKNVFLESDIGKIWADSHPEAISQTFTQITSAITREVKEQKTKLDEAKQAYKEYEDAIAAGRNFNSFMKKGHELTPETMGEEVYNSIFNAKGNFKSGGRTLLEQWLQEQFHIDPAVVRKLTEGSGQKVQEAFRQMTGDVSTALKSERKRVVDYAKEQKETTHSGADLKAAVAREDAKLTQSTSYQQGLIDANKQVEASYTSLQQKLIETQSAFDQWKRGVTSAAQNNSILTDTCSKASAQISQFQNVLTEGKAKLESLDAAANKLQGISNFVNRYIGIYAIIRKVSTAIRDAFTNIKDIDKAITSIAVVTNMSQQDLWAKIGEYTQMAQQFGVATKDVYTVSQIFYQQGLQTSQVMQMTTESLKMAKIAGIDYSTAANAMTVAVRAFKLEMSEAQSVTDAYSALAAKFAVSSSEIANAMEKTASSAASVGMSLQSTSAFISVMEQTTRESAQNIGSALKSIISRYGEMKASPNKLLNVDGEEVAFNKVDTALSSIGISIKDASGQFRDFDDVIMELAKKWDTLDNNTQRYIATIMAGNRQQSRFIALVSNYDELNRAMDTANNSENASIVQVAKTMDSIESKANQLKNAFSQLYLDLHIEDSLKGAYDWLTKILKTIGKLGTLKGVLPTLANIIGFGAGTKSLVGMTAKGIADRKTKWTVETDKAEADIKRIREEAERDMQAKLKIQADVSELTAQKEVITAQLETAIQQRNDLGNKAYLAYHEAGGARNREEFDKAIANGTNLKNEYSLAGKSPEQQQAADQAIGAYQGAIGQVTTLTTNLQELNNAIAALIPSKEHEAEAGDKAASGEERLAESTESAAGKIEGSGDKAGSAGDNYIRGGEKAEEGTEKIKAAGENTGDALKPVIEAGPPTADSLNRVRNAASLTADRSRGGTKAPLGTNSLLNQKDKKDTSIWSWKGHDTARKVTGVLTGVARLVGTAVTAIGAAHEDKSTDKVETSKMLTGLGNGLSMAGTGASMGMAFGPGGAAIGGLVGLLVGGLGSFIDGITMTLDERLALEKDEAQKAANESLKQQAKVTDIQGQLDNIAQLRKAMYNSTEDMQAYKDAMNTLASQYPVLTSAYDEQGNAIVDLQSAEEYLATVRQESSRLAREAAVAEAKTRKTQIQILDNFDNEMEQMLTGGQLMNNKSNSYKSTSAFILQTNRGSNASTVAINGDLRTDYNGYGSYDTSASDFIKAFKALKDSNLEYIDNDEVRQAIKYYKEHENEQISVDDFKLIGNYIADKTNDAFHDAPSMFIPIGGGDTVLLNDKYAFRKFVNQDVLAEKNQYDFNDAQYFINKINDFLSNNGEALGISAKTAEQYFTWEGKVDITEVKEGWRKLQALGESYNKQAKILNQQVTRAYAQEEIDIGVNTAENNISTTRGKTISTSDIFTSMLTRGLEDAVKSFTYEDEEGKQFTFEDAASWADSKEGKNDFIQKKQELSKQILDWTEKLSDYQLDSFIKMSASMDSYLSVDEILNNKEFKLDRADQSVRDEIIKQFEESNKANRDRILKTIYFTAENGLVFDDELNEDLAGLKKLNYSMTDIDLTTGEVIDDGTEGNAALDIAHLFDAKQIISKYADYFVSQLISINDLADEGFTQLANTRLTVLADLADSLTELTSQQQADMFNIITNVDFSSYDSIQSTIKNIEEYAKKNDIKDIGSDKVFGQLYNTLTDAAKKLLFNVNTLAQEVTKTITDSAKELDSIIGTNKSGVTFDKALEDFSTLQAKFTEITSFDQIFTYDTILGKYVYTSDGLQKAIEAQQEKLNEKVKQLNETAEIYTKIITSLDKGKITVQGDFSKLTEDSFKDSESLQQSMNQVYKGPDERVRTAYQNLAKEYMDSLGENEKGTVEKFKKYIEQRAKDTQDASDEALLIVAENEKNKKNQYYQAIDWSKLALGTDFNGTNEELMFDLAAELGMVTEDRQAYLSEYEGTWEEVLNKYLEDRYDDEDARKIARTAINGQIKQEKSQSISSAISEVLQGPGAAISEATAAILEEAGQFDIIGEDGLIGPLNDYVSSALALFNAEKDQLTTVAERNKEYLEIIQAGFTKASGIQTLASSGGTLDITSIGNVFDAFNLNLDEYYDQATNTWLATNTPNGLDMSKIFKTDMFGNTTILSWDEMLKFIPTDKLEEFKSSDFYKEWYNSYVQGIIDRAAKEQKLQETAMSNYLNAKQGESVNISQMSDKLKTALNLTGDRIDNISELARDNAIMAIDVTTADLDEISKRWVLESQKNIRNKRGSRGTALENVVKEKVSESEARAFSMAWKGTEDNWESIMTEIGYLWSDQAQAFVSQGNTTITAIEKYIQNHANELTTEEIHTLNDSLIGLNRKTEKNIKDEITSITSAKGGDWLNLSYFSDALNKIITDTLIIYDSKGRQEIKTTALDDLNKILSQYSAHIENSMLKLDENSNLLGVAQAIGKMAETAGVELQSDLEEIKDAIQSVLKSYIDAIIKGINGGLTNTEKLDLVSKAKNLGINSLQFTETTEGFKLAQNSAIELYSVIKNIDAMQGKLVFDELNDSLQETNEHYKSISDIMNRIQTIESMPSDTRTKQYERELALAKEILAVRSTSEDSSFSFMSNSIPGAQNNPINYFNNWASAIRTFNDALKNQETYFEGGKSFQSGIVDYDFWYNLVTEMNNIAALGGPITFAGETLDGSLEKAAALIQKGADSLVVTDTGEIKVALSKISVDFESGADAFSSNVTEGIQALAKSQSKMLDGMIKLLETVVAMEKIGDIEGAEDGTLSLDNLFPEFNVDSSDNKLANYDAFEAFLEAAGDNLNDIIINGESLKDLIHRAGTVGVNAKDAESLTSIMDSLYKMYQSGDYNLNNIYGSIQEILASSKFTGTVQLGESTLHIKEGAVIIESKKDGQTTYTTPSGGTYSTPEEAYAASVLESWKATDIDAKGKTGKLTINGNTVTLEYDSELGVIVDGKPYTSLSDYIHEYVKDNPTVTETQIRLQLGLEKIDKVSYRAIDKEVRDELEAALQAGDTATVYKITAKPEFQALQGLTPAEIAEQLGIEIVNVSVNATVPEETKTAIKEQIEAVTPQVTVTIPQPDTSPIRQAVQNMGPLSKTVNLIPTAGGLLGGKIRAQGTVGLANAKGTLMGELGPELVVSNGRYFVVGQNGPEMIDLADDAIIFNHLQTKSLLEKGMSSGRGQAVTNERNAVSFATGNVNGGPAMASASAALAALRQLKAQWDALAGLSAKDLAGKGGGGGGGGGDPKAFLKDLERWYDWLQHIAQLEKEINYEESLRNKISSQWVANGHEYYNSQKRTLEALQDQLAVQNSLTESQEAYFEKRRKELNEQSAFSALYGFSSTGQLYYKDVYADGKSAFEWLSDLVGRNETTGEANYTAEEQYKRLVAAGFEFAMKYDSSGNEIKHEGKDWYNTALQAFWDKIDADKEEMQSLHDSVEDGYKQLEDLQKEQNEILKEMRDNQMEVEQKVYDAIVEIRQRVIDELKDTKDAIQDSNDKFIQGLDDVLKKEQDMYNNDESRKDLDQLRRKRDVLVRSGGSAAEIASLNNEIANKERETYFDKQQEQIDAIQEASDKQIEKLEQQIQLETELLDYQKKYGLLWAEVTQIMSESPEEIARFIAENTEEYWNKSPVSSADAMNQLRFSTEKWVSYRDDGGLEQDITLIRKKVYGETDEEKAAKKAESGSSGSSSSGGAGSGDGKTGGAKHGYSFTYNDAKASKSGYASKDKAYSAAVSAIEAKAKAERDAAGKNYPNGGTQYEYYYNLANQHASAAKSTINAYSTGGYNYDTGLAMLHGTSEKPEAVLNAEQTKILRDNILGNHSNSLVNLLKSYNNAYHGLSQNAYDSIQNNSNLTQIDKAEINLHIDKLANDYDSRQAANTIMDEMLRIASKTKANNSVRR